MKQGAVKATALVSDGAGDVDIEVIDTRPGA